jgi:hypothetical protein
MKKHLAIVMSAFVLASIAGSTQLYAQDSATPEFEMESERERVDRERIMYSPGEGEVRYIPSRSGGIDPKSVTPAKDTTAIGKVNTVLPSPVKIKQEVGPKAPAKQQPPKEDDDAIMSFNFLYYIIQKYKLQDIIE